MNKYTKQTKMLVAVDCIVFGFDGKEIKILLIQRGFEPQKGKWSLMGGFVQPAENIEQAAQRVLKQLTGLGNVFLEELQSFSNPERDPVERTVSLAYFALIDINNYKEQISDDYHAQWFSITKFPLLIFDHNQMVNKAKTMLQYKAAMQPILLELLPLKFTLPQLQSLYEDVYEVQLDKRNFSRKVLSTGLLIKQTDKERTSSKKGAFYYTLDKRKYSTGFNELFNIISNSKIKV
jgi:8-oxo-dGTP diphosphatase